VMATTAKTKKYYNWVAEFTGTAGAEATEGNVGTQNSAAISAAQEWVVIPDLAQRLYEARSTAPWEGSVALTAQEAGAESYLGAVVRLSHADRPDWSTMRAVVQSETLRLETGETALEFGGPQHLEPQDYVALSTPAREAARESSVAPAPSEPSTIEESATLPDAPRSGGVFGGSAGPVNRATTRGLADDSLWGLDVVDPVAGTVRLARPGLIKKTAGYSTAAKVTVINVGDTFTAAAGSGLILEVTPLLAVTLKMVTLDWTGWPYPVESEATTPAGMWQMKFYRMLLWAFVGTSTDPKAVKVKDGLFAERIMEFPTHLQFFPTEMEDAAGHVVPVWELLPAPGCLRA